jgi:predicted enzyme related to lactoylglutathione lyase
MKIKSICGVIIASKKPEKLAEFYSTIFEVNFERELHGDLIEHFGVDIGEIHLGIHPPENLGKSEVGNSSVSIAYNVDSLNIILERLADLDALEVTAPRDKGFRMVATYKDPDGNQFEVVELSYEFGSA